MDKKQLSETDIRTKFITPAICGLSDKKWDLMSQIREEAYFTKGRVTGREKDLAKITSGIVRKLLELREMIR